MFLLSSHLNFFFSSCVCKLFVFCSLVVVVLRWIRRLLVTSHASEISFLCYILCQCYQVTSRFLSRVQKCLPYASWSPLCSFDDTADTGAGNLSTLLICYSLLLVSHKITSEFPPRVWKLSWFMSALITASCFLLWIRRLAQSSLMFR